MSALADLARLLADLDRAGTTVMALARGGKPPLPWVLYPDEYGIFDRKRHSQFYYHTHAGAEHEDGHFHTVRLFSNHTVHLVAISMAPTGWPQALFTLNLWAIGDRYTSPGKLDRYTREYGVESRKGGVRLVRFINLMFRAFRPEIEALQVAKGKAIEQYRATHSGADPFEDRSVEILSRIEIEIPRDLPPSRKSLNLYLLQIVRSCHRSRLRAGGGPMALEIRTAAELIALESGRDEAGTMRALAVTSSD